MSKEKKKKELHIFPVFLVYLFVLLCIGGIFLLYARKSLLLYEASQPEHVIEAVALAVSENGLHDTVVTLPDFAYEGDDPETSSEYEIHIIDNSIPCTEFEDDSEYLAGIDADIAENGVSYRLQREDFASGALIYDLYAGERFLGTTFLVPGRSYGRMHLLTMTEWFPQDITTGRPAPDCAFTVSMPEDHTITVNGMTVSSDHIVSKAAYEGLDYCKEYVSLPDEIRMHFSGLYEMPEVRIIDGEGNCVYNEVPENGAEIGIGFATPELPEELSAYVLACMERYSLFFTKDLPGSAGSIDPIRDLFPEDSIYLELADRYRREDMGVVAGHSNTHFENEAVTDYIVYSSDCFSCHVYFDKSMSLGYTERIDTTDSTCYFVCLSDRWVIADIR